MRMKMRMGWNGMSLEKVWARNWNGNGDGFGVGNGLK